MKTASWKTYTGPGRVGVCVGNPRGAPAGYRLYRALAPTRAMLSWPRERYEPAFMDMLAKLDPENVVADLERLAGRHEPHLMCFERPPFTESNFCHRRMVARWLADTLGLDVPELGAD